MFLTFLSFLFHATTLLIYTQTLFFLVFTVSPNLPPTLFESIHRLLYKGCSVHARHAEEDLAELRGTFRSFIHCAWGVSHFLKSRYMAIQDTVSFVLGTTANLAKSFLGIVRLVTAANLGLIQAIIKGNLGPQIHNGRCSYHKSVGSSYRHPLPITPSRGSISISPNLATAPLLHQCQRPRLATPSWPRTKSRLGLSSDPRIVLGARSGPVKFMPQVGDTIAGSHSASKLTLPVKELPLGKSKAGNSVRNVSSAMKRDSLYSDLLEKLRRLEAEADYDD